MRATIGLLALAVCGSYLGAEDTRRAAPSYSAAGIVNAASSQQGSLAANTIVTLYGADLSRNTRALSASDIQSGLLPTTLEGSDVAVRVNNIAATLYFVSPSQVNFLVPSNLIPGPVEIVLSVGALQGPSLRETLTDAAPALFLSEPEFAVAARPDGSLVNRTSPARPGEAILLYATGLGETRPSQIYRRVAAAAAPLARLGDFKVSIGGQELDPASVAYAGAAPGFAGLYQVNLRLPEQIADNPDIQIGFAGRMSPRGVRVPLANTPEPGATKTRLH